MIELGKVIRRRREAARLSQMSFALAIGYKNNSDVSRIENGAQWPDAEKLEAISQALNCSVTELFREAERWNKVEEARPDYLGNGGDQAVRRSEDIMASDKPPNIEDALKMVELMLSNGIDRERLAATAYQGLVSRYYGERICSSLADIAMALGALRDELEAGRTG